MGLNLNTALSIGSKMDLFKYVIFSQSHHLTNLGKAVFVLVKGSAITGNVP